MNKGLFRKGLILGIILLFVGAGIIPSSVGIIKEKTPIQTIGNRGYIQDLIDNASEGDIIYIPNGTYYENIVIDKSISLIGEDKNTTVIDGNYIGDVIKISANWINISGFTIRNSAWYFGKGIFINSNYNIITDNTITNCNNGINLYYFGNNTIIHNTINAGWGDCGIYLHNSLNNTIIENNISEGYLAGIKLYGKSNNNTFSRNNISNSYFCGIWLESSSSNIFINNYISKNVYGFWIDGNSNNNNLSGNTISNNLDEGIRLDKSSYSILRNNKIINNRYNFKILGNGVDQYLHDIDVSNTVNGKPVYYWIEIENAEIPFDAGYVGLVNCTNINVKNLTLKNNYHGISLIYTQNSTIANNNISNNRNGLWLQSSSGNVITGNNILDNFYGIDSFDSPNNTISNNTIFYNSRGIEGSHYNTITGNNISNNREIGLHSYSYNTIIDNNILNNGAGIDPSSFDTIIDNNISYNDCGISSPGDYCIISGNIISKNKNGIGTFLSYDNIIIRNIITSNSEYGISLYSSQRNKIYHNIFINNSGNQGFLDNEWDNGFLSGGNYWDDYTGMDYNHGQNQDIQGHDRFGDTPYKLNIHEQDNYPLMSPNDWINHAPKNITIDGPTSGRAGDELNFTVIGYDLDGDPIYYMFDWDDGTKSDWLGPYPSGTEGSGSHSWKRGTYNIMVKVKDTRELETEWSEPLSITIPRNRISFSLLSLKLIVLWFERFPILERLLYLLL